MMLGVRQRNAVVSGKDFMTPVLVVPLGERRGHVHFLDNVAPADAGVIGAEGNFAFLGSIRDDALLGAAEIIVEQILEPHAGNEQEIPPIFAALLDVINSAVA